MRFIRTSYEQQRFETANADLTSTALRVNRIFVLAMPALMGIMNVSTVAVLWFGGGLVDSGQMPIGNLTAFLMYLMQILFAVMMAVAMVILVPRAEASAARIEEVMRTAPSIADPEQPVEAPSATGVVEFRGVSFGYPGGEHPVLSDLSFVFQPGETTAIIGGTGSGKTTLLNLIPRFFDVTSGEVLVDGVDVRKQALEGLWSAIGLVPQRAYLFSGTVAEEPALRPGRATDEELWHALEVAQAPRLRRRDARPASMLRSTRAAPTSRAASGSGWRSPARLSSAPSCICSTTASPLWTPAPMPACGRPWTREAQCHRRHRRAEGEHDHACAPHPRYGRWPDRGVRHPRRADVVLRSYREIVESQLGEAAA